ncbi:MAG: outer membrane protein assembly factor BamB [Planctomycetota bacterium]|jgi:outer membrane protein assembly factor BamB
MRPLRLAVPLALVCFFASHTAAQEWTRFRGPNGSGVSSSTGLPVEFGAEKNVAWKTELPSGRSSPVFTEDALYLTGSDDEKLYVFCLNPADGTRRWTRELDRARREEIYGANDSASPTPVTDGENVYVFFPELGLLAFDGKGEERWRMPLGPFVSFYGMAASPVIVDDTLILLCDQQHGSYLLAVDIATGEQRWRTERTGMIEGWTTPALFPADKPDTIVVLGSFFLCGYALDTGEEKWRKPGMGYAPACSPIVDGDRIFASVQRHAEQPMPSFDSVLADKDADGDGVVTQAEAEGHWMIEHWGWVDANRDDRIDAEEWSFINAGMTNRDYGLFAIDISEGEAGATTTVGWRYKRSLPEVASPLLYDGVIYLVKSGGILTSVDALSGEAIKSERIRSGGSEYHGSPVAADGKLYIPSNVGEISVVSLGGEWELLGVNDLGEPIESSPAVDRDSLYVRTESALYCFRNSTED